MERKTVWDPLRKKNVALTPEEDVRQWFISQLNESMNVPRHMMMSEVSISLYERKFRADIVVYGRNAAPVAVVECKRPETALDRSVLDQVVGYNMVLDVGFIFITNGHRTCVCMRKPEGGYGFVRSLPSYDEMCKYEKK